MYVYFELKTSERMKALKEDGEDREGESNEQKA